MAEMTEIQIAKQKDAVDAMRNAGANMRAVLERNQALELALMTAVESMRRTKDYIGSATRMYATSGETIHEMIDKQIASAQRALG